MPLPLEGVRVLDFGSVWMGPVLGQTLAFMGAEVYLVESRARLDLSRMLPPFAEGVQDPERSLQNHAAWAGNGSITLNLTKPEARDLVLRLVSLCDVVAENLGPGVMEKLGLGPQELRKVNPRLITIFLRPAGMFGPLSHLRTYGVSLTSITGLDSITGYGPGDLQTFENAFADPLLGVAAAFAVVAALRYRDLTGQGLHIDFSQQEAVMQLMGPHVMDYFFNRRVAGPLGNRHPLGVGAPHGVFRCRGDDRWISIACLEEEEWQGLVEAMGRPNWALDPRFATAQGRLQHIDELHARLEEWTADKDQYELAHLLQSHGVAAAPVLDIAGLYHDPHLRARGTFVEVEHPLGFRETIYGAYVKMSRTPPRVRPGPMMGQDNEKVFKGLLGLSEAEYRRLVEAQVIY